LASLPGAIARKNPLKPCQARRTSVRPLRVERGAAEVNLGVEVLRAWCGFVARCCDLAANLVAIPLRILAAIAETQTGSEQYPVAEIKDAETGDR